MYSDEQNPAEQDRSAVKQNTFVMIYEQGGLKISFRAPSILHTGLFLLPFSVPERRTAEHFAEQLPKIAY